MNDENNINNINNTEDINNNEDTIYFGDSNPNEYESSGQKPYTEEDMYEDYKPMTNVNSVEYDEGDYAYSNYDALDEDGKDDRKKIIIGYIFVLVVIVIIVIFSILKLK